MAAELVILEEAELPVNLFATNASALTAFNESISATGQIRRNNWPFGPVTSITPTSSVSIATGGYETTYTDNLGRIITIHTPTTARIAQIDLPTDVPLDSPTTAAFERHNPSNQRNVSVEHSHSPSIMPGQIVTTIHPTSI
ncbi:hypothetical protein DFJ43DRAFT_1158853 [Lentinula guzmanii]|uniref:Uncharacterized protein n=1 Tax=Lentinula guzmanii TaxID=2804957 RepID=A0AA38J4L5_9AGAR|nr:hypothetical protein DFJ43DRAFT_1158853 [Lentinula guzmanii]